MKTSPAASLLPLAFLSSFTTTTTTAYAASIENRAVEAPAISDNGWKYQGCFVDVGHTFNKAATASAGMTNQVCTSYCYEKGYPWAGTEYFEECYCGKAPAAGGVKTDESDCSTPCRGNATQPCGGPNRLTVYHSTKFSFPAENPGVKNWPSIGCYKEGTTGRALTAAYNGVANANMTVAKCTAGCKASGYILAGLEYGGECWCGDKFSNNAEPADDGCDVPCNGNHTELCGGSNRLNVYDFKMEYPVTRSTISTTSEDQTDTATTSVASETDAVTTSDVIETTTATAPDASETTPAECPAQPATVGEYSFYGCYTEATNIRALSEKATASDVMTLAACATFCKGYMYFGTEYSRECYCGDDFNTGSVKTGASECNMACSGASCTYCGAGNRLSVYTLGEGEGGDPSTADPTPSSVMISTGSSAPTLPISTDTTSAITPSTDLSDSTMSISTGVAPTTTSVLTSIASSTATGSTPGSTGFPAGWQSYGCWVDGANGRILNKQVPDDADLTLESCAKACFDLGYTIAGAEYFTQCFCGNQIINGGVKADSASDCSTTCGGDPDQKCGGPDRMSIISNGEPEAVSVPMPVQAIGDWTYKGCYEDNINDKRTFFWQLYFDDMTPSDCLDACADFGYMAAGLEYGRECYCGDPANIKVRGSEKVDDSECGIPCAGNATAICGGGARLSTYFWEGEPFYSWAFPADGTAAAGSYEQLIGGVCIPLMTSQSITGKVTFVEKWGTGPPNSTGAYELDLSLVDDYRHAWREMHVKTDVFCAAGVTLPDKAGRQLTVGGWSGDSTYGVRLYTPDGSAGVNGTNDWEENVDVLKLQDGRWYPSTMNMANGSILVIGGEEGSNGAPVPTLEILPYTGTAPLYMDWLERTDPNNLYPFVCVLPSGGIFVAYWNEARILDENTFSTKKTLPNIPGAVNNPMGGRTYPLEGTSVLLPQHAPYTEPLGILICGGSSNVISNGLDNCVSIQPDAAKPKWELERMPSQRVMSCIAPLPDGTYLILNGAHKGVAGFGLGEDPNLNALLYDPTKDLGHRITVMANTTVARMYHSEAITLLDGRVLVSGSDPQDGRNPQEYRVETFTPPYLKKGLPRPSFTVADTDWTYGQQVTVKLGSGARNGAISASLLGSVSSTHGNSMGARTLVPAISCSGTTCTVTAPPGKYIAPPGWYQLFILDGGIPAVGVFVRIGGDPANVGNWPAGKGFTTPGV